MKETFSFAQDDIADLYADTVHMAVGPYDFVMEFGLSGVPHSLGAEPPPARPIARVRMSPQHALIFAKLLRKNLDLYQDQMGKINLARQIYDDLHISPD